MGSAIRTREPADDGVALAEELSYQGRCEVGDDLNMPPEEVLMA
jgi:hypothetical protein